MRPHLALHASIICFIEASRATSASKLTASPPPLASFFAISTVSSAEAMSLSAQKTFAPSCTKRMTVARPLPMPVPGPCPAPTTIAILSFSRMASVPICLFCRHDLNNCSEPLRTGLGGGLSVSAANAGAAVCRPVWSLTRELAEQYSYRLIFDERAGRLFLQSVHDFPAPRRTCLQRLLHVLHVFFDPLRRQKRFIGIDQRFD